MTVSLSAVHILASDPDAALAFYRDVLGFEPRTEVAQGGFRWITLSPPDQPAIEIVLSHPRVGHSPEDGAVIEALLAKGELPPVMLRASDLDEVFARVRAAKGAEIVQEPMDQPWGVRDGAFRDPSGNLIRLAQA